MPESAAEPAGEPPAAPPAGPPGGAGPDLPRPVMTARLAAVVLLLEAFVVFFATIAGAVVLSSAGTYRAGTVWGAGLVLALVCVLVSAVVRRPGGIAAGSAVQVVLIATGVFVPAMYAVGALFAVLWVWLVSIGRRVDADRRRWARQVAAALGRPGDHGSGGATSAH